MQADVMRSDAAAIAAWLERAPVFQLPPGKANATAIATIRAAGLRGEAYTARRKGGRLVVFSASEGSDSQAAGEHPGAAARSRRRFRRSATKPPA